MKNLKILINENKKDIITYSIILILLISQIFQATILFSKPEETKEEISIDELEKEEQQEQLLDKVSIDIKGEVSKPGMYVLTSDKRVLDAIKASGGLTKNADTSNINLSAKLTDEMVIIIYSKEQIKNLTKTTSNEEKIKTDYSNKINTIKNNNTPKSTTTKEEQTKNIKVSLNNATKQQLEQIPGIGQSKAQNIIDYRNEKGGFLTIDEITKVKGIGKSIYDKIKDYLTL